MNKFRKILMLTALSTACMLCLGGCGNQQKTKAAATTESENVMATSHRIIIDTDTAGDDAMAILMALKAPNVTVEGITVLGGNVPLDQAVDNALMCVEVSGKTEVPVYRGSETTYNGTERTCFSVFGDDGMGDADLIHPTIEAQTESAVDFILDTVKENPGEIDLVCLGPVTNIALALDKDPETMSKVRSVYVMGSSGFGPGNATPVAEFNAYHDAAAFERVLESGISMTVIGLDVCGSSDVVFYEDQINAWKEGSDVQKFLATSWGKLFDFYTKNGTDYIMVCDAVAMYTLIYDDALTGQVECSGVCITDSTPAYGEVIFYKKGFTYDSMPQIDSYPVSVVTGLNVKSYHDRMDSLLQ